MADLRADQDIQQSGTAMKRRGILAAAAAVVAGLVAKLAEAPVEATSGGGDQGFLALGSNPWYISGSAAANAPAISSAPTVIQASANLGNFVGGNGADPVLFEVDARPSGGTVSAIYALTDGNGIGVFGSGSYGVWGNGTNTGVFGSGPIGLSGSGATTGVSGFGVTGVLGQSVGPSGGVGVRGNIPNSTNAASTIAVYGANLSSSDGGAPGAGGFGCYGVSLKGHGLVGATGTAGGGAVVGATNGVSGAWAGIFYGPVAITGLKSAAVAHPDGTHRLLYCVEKPGELVRGLRRGAADRRHSGGADRPGVRSGRGDEPVPCVPHRPCQAPPLGDAADRDGLHGEGGYRAGDTEGEAGV